MMDKRWYPLACSAIIVGCGGDTQSGDAAGTGGKSGGIDGGTPHATGGMWSVYYGISIGGSFFQTGGSTSTGGTSSIDSGTPAATGGRFPIIVYGMLPPPKPSAPTKE
jgi:hypothetical protein